MTESFLSFTAPHISVDGELQDALTRDLLQLEIAEGNDGLRTMRARFVAFGPHPDSREDSLLYLDGDVFDFGSAVEVTIGPEDASETVFSGTVSAIEAEFTEGHEPEVVLLAEDKLMELRLTRRMASYEEMSDADIAKDIADKNGLDSDIDIDGPVYDVVQQWNMSDLAFLRERAHRLQADVWFADGKLHVKARPSRSGNEISLVQGNHLVHVSACADLTAQRSEVRVCGYNAQDRELIDESADGDAIQAELADGRTGADILARVFSGDRVSYRVRDVPLNADEAQAWARAEMLRRARSFVKIKGTTRGTPEMNVGSTLNLERVGTPFEGGGYYVVGVRHTYDLSCGYRTSFEAQRGAVEVAA